MAQGETAELIMFYEFDSVMELNIFNERRSYSHFSINEKLYSLVELEKTNSVFFNIC